MFGLLVKKKLIFKKSTTPVVSDFQVKVKLLITMSKVCTVL